MNRKKTVSTRNAFDFYKRSGCVMFSAPHAVEHKREGIMKPAEPSTGIIVKQLADMDFPGMVKNAKNTEDPNFNMDSSYKLFLSDYISKNNINLLFDLHELNPSRPMSICIGTGRGKNVKNNEKLVTIVKNGFEAAGFENVTVDDPFAGATEVTVASYVSKNCNIPAFQIEMNSGLFRDNAENVEKVVETLCRIAKECEEML